MVVGIMTAGSMFLRHLSAPPATREVGISLILRVNPVYQEMSPQSLAFLRLIIQVCKLQKRAPHMDTGPGSKPSFGASHWKFVGISVTFRHSYAISCIISPCFRLIHCAAIFPRVSYTPFHGSPFVGLSLFTYLYHLQFPSTHSEYHTVYIAFLFYPNSDLHPD